MRNLFTKRNILACAVLMALLMALAVSTASAATAKLQTTQNFLAILTEVFPADGESDFPSLLWLF